MAKDSRSDREKLKKEYKAHYRKIHEAKERLSRSQTTQNISRALKNMDTGQMMDSFDSFLWSFKHKLASVEARLDGVIESIGEENQERSEQELDEELNKEKAKDTLRQVKMEMGLLYKEIEKQADAIEVNKTIGNNAPENESNNEQS